LDEWLHFQQQQHPQAIDLGLDRLWRVLERLGWRAPEVPVLTIAGTNGKGSVVAFSESILSAGGYQVGVFTSPHLRDYRERIHLRGSAVGAPALIGAFERIEAARGDISLTFFEYNTLAALLVFAEANLDVWILEVGLGGRLDAVNCIDPDVAVIVSIGFDHQEFLGHTLAEIGREKAGILRPGRPAVLGSCDMPAAVLAAVQAIGAHEKRLGKDFRYDLGANGWTFYGPYGERQLPPPGLWGAKQYDNAATAVAAVEELRLPRALAASAFALGIGHARLPGRFQRIGAQPEWILDVAHNPAAAEVLAANLRASLCRGRTLAVCGILADKDAAAVVNTLAPLVDRWWFVSLAGARGSSGELLRQKVRQYTDGTACESVAAGCEQALAGASPLDRIVVFGSFHTVGPALAWLETLGRLE
jgi:dihydrofolate synthase / folylpolyglutamate synthase